MDNINNNINNNNINKNKINISNINPIINKKVVPIYNNVNQNNIPIYKKQVDKIIFNNRIINTTNIIMIINNTIIR